MNGGAFFSGGFCYRFGSSSADSGDSADSDYSDYSDDFVCSAYPLPPYSFCGKPQT